MLLELPRQDEFDAGILNDGPAWPDLKPVPAPNYDCVSPLSGRLIEDLSVTHGPQVETARLRLRPFVMDDFADYAEMMADSDNWKYAKVGAMNGEESWTRFLRHIGHWQLLGFGTFGVFDRETGQFVGEVGLSQFNRNLGGHFDWAPEASWMVVTDRKNEGLASEAVAGALSWMERTLGATRTVCIIHEDNAASLRVADKLGYRPFKRSEFHGYPAVFFERVVIGL